MHERTNERTRKRENIVELADVTGDSAKEPYLRHVRVEAAHIVPQGDAFICTMAAAQAPSSICTLRDCQTHTHAHTHARTPNALAAQQMCPEAVPRPNITPRADTAREEFVAVASTLQYSSCTQRKVYIWGQAHQPAQSDDDDLANGLSVRDVKHDDCSKGSDCQHAGVLIAQSETCHQRLDPACA